MAHAETTVYFKVAKSGRRPAYATIGSAGCDLYAAEDLTLLPGETKLLPLDLTIALEPGIEAQIRPRSGLSLKTSLRIANSPGTVDSDFRSPVCVILENTFSQANLALMLLSDATAADQLSRPDRQTTLGAYLGRDKPDLEKAKILERLGSLGKTVIYLAEDGLPYGTITIKKGERIAQMVLARYVRGNWQEHDDPSSVGSNRGGGFGSTGMV